MLGKIIIDCERLETTQEIFYDEVSFSKVANLECNFAIKRTYLRFFLEYVSKTSCVKKNKKRKKSMVDQRLNKALAL